MLLAVAVTLWFLCGLLAIYMAFLVARSRKDIFDPVHIWLAVLGPLGLLLACLTFVWGDRPSPA
jgi:hypothetical protein